MVENHIVREVVLGRGDAADSVRVLAELWWRAVYSRPDDVAASVASASVASASEPLRRASHSEPGVSVSPWARIEHTTTSAATPKSRRRPRSRGQDSSEKVIVATPRGPNQAMKALVAVSSRVPASATQTATGRATSSVTTTIATAAPLGEQAVRASAASRTRRTPRA